MVPTTLLEAALYYAALSWFIFPITEDGKSPLTRHGFRDATTNPDQIRAWWTETPNARVGVWCRASGFIVLDIDGKEGAAKFAELEAELGPVPRIFVQSTGGKGGTHILLKDPSYDPDRDLSLPPVPDIVGNIGGAGVIDVKCNGYIVLAPSAAGKYSWLAFDEAKPIPPVPMIWRSRIVRTPLAVSTEIPQVMDGDLAERVERGRQALYAYVERTDTDTSRLMGLVLQGQGGEGCGTGNVRIGKIAYTIGLYAPDIGADGAIEIMRGCIGQVQGLLAHSPERLRDRAADCYRSGAAEGAKKQRDGQFLEQLFGPISVRLDHAELTRPKAKQRATLAFDVLDELYAKAQTPSVLTPWHKFNAMSEGLELGTVTYFVGYQGSGKSSFAVQLGVFHARNAGHTIYYLAEMTKVQLVARMLGQDSKSGWRAMSRGSLPRAEAEALLRSLNLHIISRDPDPIGAIKQTISDLRAQGVTTPIMLVVDYVQLLAPVGKDMRVANTDVARQLLELTESEGLVTVALSQTSRSNSKRIREGAADSVDLADTGAESSEFERSAAIQGVLSYQQKDDTRVNEITMSIAKRRFGGPTKCYFLYDGLTGLWTEPDKPILAKVEQDRESEILIQLRNHACGRCITDVQNPSPEGMAFCHRAMLPIEFSRAPHKVSGRAVAVKATLDRLVKEGLIIKIGSAYAVSTIPHE